MQVESAEEYIRQDTYVEILSFGDFATKIRYQFFLENSTPPYVKPVSRVTNSILPKSVLQGGFFLSRLNSKSNYAFLFNSSAQAASSKIAEVTLEERYQYAMGTHTDYTDATIRRATNEASRIPVRNGNHAMQ